MFGRAGVIMALGYVFGKLRYFDDDQRQGLNKVVLNVALPAALFVSIVKATREMLAQDVVLTLISLIGVVGMFMLSYFLCRIIGDLCVDRGFADHRISRVRGSRSDLWQQC